MNKKTQVLAIAFIALICLASVAFVSSLTYDGAGNPRGVQIVNYPALTQAVEDTAVYPYYVVAGYGQGTTPPAPATSPTGFTFTMTPSVADFGNIGSPSRINSNKSASVTIVNTLGQNIYITNLTAEVTSGDATDPFETYSGFTLVGVDILDLGLDRPAGLDPEDETWCMYDECNYWQGEVSANPDNVVTINNLHRDQDTYYGAAGSPTPANEILTGPGGLVLPEQESFDAIATEHVAPIYLAAGQAFTEYFAVKVWGETTGPTQIDGTITITLEYIVVQTSEAKWYATGAVGTGYYANAASAPYDQADNIDFVFTPDREETDEILNRGLTHLGTPVYSAIPSSTTLFGMTITNNKGYDITIVDIIMNLTECTPTIPYNYASSGRWFANTSMLHMSSLNAMEDGELAGKRFVDQDETRQAFPWWNNECGMLSTGNDPQQAGEKMGPVSMRETPGSQPRSTISPPELFSAGSTINEAFAGRWFGYAPNGTQVVGTVNFKLLYRIIEEPPVLDVTIVSPSKTVTTELPTCGPVQVDVTVVNTGGSPIVATVGALFLDSYSPNWAEIGTQTVSLTPGANLVSFNWNFEATSPITDRSEIRRDLGVTPWYGSWQGHALKGMVIATIPATGVDHFDELISGSVALKMPGDGDGSGKINYVDLGAIASAYGSTPSDGNWNEQADYNCSNKVNYVDLGLIAANYGRDY